MRFSRTDISKKFDFARRSSGTSATPACIIAFGEGATHCSLTKTCPECRGLKPTIVSTNSVRPAPASPAMPVICPGKNSSDTPLTEPNLSLRSSTRTIGFVVAALFTAVCLPARCSTIRSSNQLESTSEAGAVSMNCPSRKTVYRSEISNISRMRCEIKTTATPSSRSWRITRKSESTSLGSSAEVGSSRSKTRVSNESARAISINCCRLCESDSTWTLGSRSKSRRLSRVEQFLFVSDQLIPNLFRLWLWPRKTFSAALKCGTRLNSCDTTVTPNFIALRTSGNTCSWPSIAILP